MRRYLLAAPLLALGATGLAAWHSNAHAVPADPNDVAYAFVVIGCNRVAAADTAGNLSTANVQQLDRTFAEVAALSPRPAFLFFAGDEVLGNTNDTTTLARELEGWVALYRASPLASSGVELVALPGNHEMQSAARIATPSAERTWLRIMAPYIGGSGNGPRAGGADGLATDQSRLTYSFDYKDAHFVTLNTDPVGNDWHAPTAWVASDLSSARTRGQKHVFAIGHKPAYPYPAGPTDGLSKDVPARDAFWRVLTENRTEAMFSAHNHVFYHAQPDGHTWMVIAGNGGSSLDAKADQTIPGTGLYFGYTLVTVTNGGRVLVRSYGRDVPAGGYTASAAATPTTMRDSVEITWR